MHSSGQPLSSRVSHPYKAANVATVLLVGISAWPVPEFLYGVLPINWTMCYESPRAAEPPEIAHEKNKIQC